MKYKWMIGMLVLLCCAEFARAQNPPIIQVVGGSAIATSESVNITTTGSGHVFIALICAQLSQGPQTPVDNAPGGSSIYLPIPGSYQVGPAGTAGTNYFCEYFIANPGKPGATQVTLNSSGSDEAQLWFYELTGLAANPVDQAGGNSGLTSTPALVGPALTTTSPNELLLQVGYLFDGVYGVTPPWTQDVDVTEGGNVDTAHLITSAIGTYAANFVVSPDGRSSWTSGISLKLAAPVSLAPVVQRSGWNVNCAASGSCTTPISPTKAGDLLAVSISLAGSSAAAIGTVTVTDSAGQTYTPIGAPLFQPAVNANNTAETWYFNGTAAGVTGVTVSSTASAGIYMDVVELSGIAAGNPVDAQAGAVSSAPGTVFSSGNIFTSSPNDILLGFETNDYLSTIAYGGAGPATQGPGYVALDEYAGYGTAYQLAGPVGSYAGTFVSDVRSNTCYTCSGTPTVQSVDWTASVVAFKPVVSAPTFNISGTIAGGAGATVALTGTSTASIIADASGNYAFTSLANGQYTVTPSAAGLTFAPSSQGVTVNNANATAINFAATAAPSISGTITGGAGVTVTLSGPAAATTTANASGVYTFTGLATGRYTVTPSGAGFTFSPVNLSVTVNTTNVTGVNFTATALPSISGTISGGAGATVTLSGAATANIVADASGNYIFKGLSNGSYTITPSALGLTFAPVSQTVTLNNASITGVNFTTILITYSISGTISPAANGSGALVTLSGAASRTESANAAGYYEFDNLLNGSYTITPGQAGLSFSPTSLGVTVNNISVSGLNFTGAVVQTSPIAIDANVSKDSSAASATVTTGTFSTTSPNELLLALISTDYFSGPNTTVTNVSGGGLTWTLVNRTNAQLGTAEIWRAFATGAISNATVTASLSQSVGSSLTVISFSGVNTTGTGGSGAIGAIGTGNAHPGAPTASLVTTQANSWVLGVGNDWDNLISRTPGAGQAVVHQYLAPAFDTYWVQRVTTLAAAGTSVTLNDTAPTTDRYNLSLVEILPPPTGAPQVSLSSTDLNFGGQPIITSSAAQNITLTNTGNAALNITNIVSTGDYGETETCGPSLEAGAGCVISVVFVPTAQGTRTGTLTILDNAVGSPQIINLTGVGTVGSINLSNSTLTFASQQSGTTSAAQTVTVYNTGNGAVSIASIGATGANAADFLQSNNCGISLAAGGTCVINVNFAPQGLGARSASIAIVDTAAGSPQTISLSGTGAGSFVSLSTASLAFSAQVLGVTSAGQTLSVTNTGNQTLSISGIAVTGTNNTDFAQTNNCGSALTAGSACTLTVTFKPTAPGKRIGAIAISDGATGSPQTVSLSGTGNGPVVSLSGSSLAFTAVPFGTSSAPQPITLTNSGNQPLTITAIAVTGTNSADFSQTNTCVSPIAAAATCAINVTFTPSASGTRTASVTITDGAAGSPHSFTLSGTGTGPFVGLSATTLAFSGQTVNTTSAAKSVVVTNTGDQTLSITSIALGGTNSAEFTILNTSTCGASLVAAATCSINVTFTPQASGARAAAITLTDSAVGSPLTITLTGMGNGAAASLSQASLTFAGQTLGTTAAAQPVTLSNTGNQALAITSIAVTGTNSAEFAQTNNCGASVAAGSACTVNVTFGPTATGTRSASVTITDGALGSPQTIGLTGTGNGPVVSLSGSTLSFSAVPFGTASASQPITLTNIGNQSLTIASITLTGTNSADYSQSNNCASPIAAAASCSINVTFTPSAPGTRAASVTITDGALGSPHTIALTGTGSGPFVGLSAATLTFTGQALNTTSAAKTVTVTNTGDQTLSIAGMVLGGTNSAEFAIANTSTCGASLAAAAACNINVTFTPQAPGARAASITVTDGAVGSPRTITLTGTGNGGAVNLSLSSLTFSSQALGTTSAAQAVTLTNTGNQALAVTSIAITGTNNTDFAQTNTCGASVAAGGTCTVNVTFKPTGTDSRTASVTITDAAIGSPQTIVLTGTGTGAVVSLSGSSLSFTAVPFGTSSASQPITLTNTGNQPLIITTIAVTGANSADFGQTNTCVSPIAAAASCTINVSFSPSAPGTRAASVTITDAALGSPHTITLSGTGSGSFLGLSATTLTFTSQALGTTSAAKTITVTNTGDQALSIADISVTGTNNAEFAIVNTSTCGATLAAAAACNINVTFAPQAPGARTASVTITDGAVGSPHAVALTGTGNGPAVGLSQSTLTFASQALGTTSASQGVTVTNTGTQTLSISSIALSGANSGDFAQTNTCGTSLAAGGTCTVTVTFKPTATGARAASVTLTDGAVGSPQSITLSGTGSGAVVSLSGTSLTFTAVPFGTSSASQPITLTNSGNQPLTITSIAVTGANAADFAQTNTCVSPIAAAANCVINVTFTPSAPGTRAASVTITDGALGSPHTIALTGTGAGPFVALTSSALTFTPQLLNTTSAAQTVTLSNTGTQALSISSIVLGGTNSTDFANTTTCGASLAASATCTISATFTPTATGARTASITITDGAASSPNVITLTGTGATTFSISGTISPAASGSGATVNLTGAATATTTADINGLYTFSGLANGAYTVTPTKAGNTFAPASQPVTINNAVATGVNFTATATPIAIDATVSKDQATASTTVAATALTTKATNELLLAFVSTDGPSTGANTTVSSIAGGGLTWALVVRTNTQLGSSEIWRAFATTTLSSVTVTATLSQKMTSSMTVMSFTGANTTGTAGSGAIGATGTANANPGAPSASLITTQANSMVLGVGNDWDNATSRTAGANQTVVHQYLSPNGDTYWAQRVTTSAAAGTTVTINDTAPAADRYNLSIVEVRQ